MYYKKKPGEVAFDTVNYIFMFLLMIVTLYPFIHMLATSFSASKNLTGYRGFMFWPRGFSLEAYDRALNASDTIKSFINSIFYVVTGTTIHILLTLMGGYVLSRRDIYWKNFIVIFLVIPMYFGGGLIPTYLMVSNALHMRNTIWAIIIPGCIGTYNMILMRTNFQQIPIEMEESAIMDGAPHMRILFKILLPLSLPIVSVLMLFHGVGLWNAWFGPAIYLTSRNLWPISLILREVMISTEVRNPELVSGISEVSRPYFVETLKSAIAIISIVPIIMVYPFLQKYFVKGIFVGAIKG